MTPAGEAGFCADMGVAELSAGVRAIAMHNVFLPGLAAKAGMGAEKRMAAGDCQALRSSVPLSA